MADKQPVVVPTTEAEVQPEAAAPEAAQPAPAPEVVSPSPVMNPVAVIEPVWQAVEQVAEQAGEWVRMTIHGGGWHQDFPGVHFADGVYEIERHMSGQAWRFADSALHQAVEAAKQTKPEDQPEDPAK